MYRNLDAINMVMTLRCGLMVAMSLQLILAVVLLLRMHQEPATARIAIMERPLRIFGRRTAYDLQNPVKIEASCQMNVTAIREEVERVMNLPDITERLAWTQLDSSLEKDHGADGMDNANTNISTFLLQVARNSRITTTAPESVPTPRDVLAELGAYYRQMLAATFQPNQSMEQGPLQATSTSKQLGLWPADAMQDLESVSLRIHFTNWLAEEVAGPGLASRVAICCTWAGDVWRLRRELLPWLQYHTQLGVTRFYVLYDGGDHAVLDHLRHLHSVRVMLTEPPHASAAEVARFHAWALSQSMWSNRPGNYQLMVKQGYGMTEALRLALGEGMEWLLHIDPDEFIHPGDPGFSLAAELAAQPPTVSSLRFMNVEAQPEAADITNRYEQVTLFRSHRHFITPEVSQLRQLFKLGGNRAFLNMYANGKSAVRIDAPGVRQQGPHFFHGSPSPRWRTAENPRGSWVDHISPSSLVLHYAYCQPEDVVAKAARGCDWEAAQAARRGDLTKAAECFVIDFDWDAFLAAASPEPSAAMQFFLERMVLSEGSPLACVTPSGKQGWCRVQEVERLKALLLRAGLYLRLHTPRTILQSHERIIALMAGQPGTWMQRGTGPGAGGWSLEQPAVGTKSLAGRVAVSEHGGPVGVGDGEVVGGAVALDGHTRS